MPATIPPPTDADSEDVHWALTTAQSLEAQGDYGEALRWLRRAVAAAATQADHGRASELERCAASLENVLKSQPSERRNTTDVMPPLFRDEREGDAPRMDDLDQPTHVDPSSRSVHAEEALTDSRSPAIDSEITLVPFTMKAVESPAGALPPRAPAHAAAPRAARRGSDTLEVAHFEAGTDPRPGHEELPPYVEEGEESTLAMRAAPNQDEISDVDSMVGIPSSHTARAIEAVPRHRVALLASPDGHDPRVMLLRDGMQPPPGAGIAMLIPSSSQDAKIVAQLLSPENPTHRARPTQPGGATRPHEPPKRKT